MEHIGSQQGIEGHTIYSGCQFLDGKMDDFGCNLMNKVVKMQNFDANGCFEDKESKAELTGRLLHEYSRHTPFYPIPPWNS